jgi:GNAT superfamily N-acetyltransferase
MIIRQMTEADVDFGLTLDELAGWNQLRADWVCLLRTQPDGCFVAEQQGRPVATITTTSYGTDLAWIGMMLVHPEFRRQGIATRLLQHAIQWLKNQEVRCIKLDATPAGAAVYANLGFQAEWNFHRWTKTGKSQNEALPQERTHFSLPDFDEAAFGADRSVLLRLMAAGSVVEATDNGFGMLRSGRLADYLGPVTARTMEEAESLLARLLARTSRTVFWDIPGPNVAATRLAQTMGFVPVRDLTRMWLGDRMVPRTIEYQFALASPATG